MKTAISLDDDLLRQADHAARQMCLSRSGLFALALHDYLRQRRQIEMVERLNQIYGGEAKPPEKRTAKKLNAKLREDLRDRW